MNNDDSGNTVNGWAWSDAQEGFVYDESSEERHRHQVGSIFAVQGQDLDYAGVIVARDISYDGQHVHGYPKTISIHQAASLNPKRISMALNITTKLSINKFAESTMSY